MSGLFPPTDKDLIRRLGEPASAAAWDQFVAAYRGGIVRACRASGLDAATAEDLTQDVLVRVITRWDQYDPSRPFRPWLNGVIRHIVLDHKGSAWVRKARPASGGDEAAWLEQLADSISAVLGSDERLLLHVAIDRVRGQVPARDWEAFRRLKLEGQPAKEVAAALGITAGNVNVIAHRFKKHLEQTLGEMGYTP